MTHGQLEGYILRGFFSEIELPRSYNAHSRERAPRHAINMYMRSTFWTRYDNNIYVYMLEIATFSKEVLKFMKINNDCK